MRVPIEWLKEYVDFKDSPEKLAGKLLMAGIEAIPLKSLPYNYNGVVIGEIKEIKKHPNADKLQVAMVDIGKEVLQIICGAPNIEVDQKVPVALVGAEFGEFEIKEAEIRGIKSYGMICSEAELGISDDHTGIMVLDPEAVIGSNLSEELSKETVLECEITPNRGDLLSIIGIAREVAVIIAKDAKPRLASGRKERKDFSDFASLKKRKFSGLAKEKAEDFIDVKVFDSELCPRYVARVIKDVKIGPSPKWMQDRLSACGVRPTCNVVDITNYVMLEWGQPLHAFDMEKLKVKSEKLKVKEIIVRRAKVGEEIETLDGTKRKLDSNMLVIANQNDPIAVAGVMGGANSEVSEQTTTVILESATFHPTSVRKTAQKLGLRSEASNRFEKGIPAPLNEVAIDRASELMAEICGGKVLSGRVDVLSKWIWIQHIGLQISKIKRILGLEISEKEIIEILKFLGFEAEKFDITAEARKHLGKPYVLGASFKTHGTNAFDCSYLTDYIYSRIGKFIGHTALAQIELGKPVKGDELLPGDIIFINGVIDKSVTDHYFIPDSKSGYKKVLTKNYPKGVGHDAVYIGDGKIIHAKHYDYDFLAKKSIKLEEGKVSEESIDIYLKRPDYLGARRYVENLDDYIAVTVPWWRLDVCIEEDLIEEVARIYGYDKFPSTLPSGELPEFKENPEVSWSEKAKDILCGAGFSEVYSYSFVSEDHLKFIGANLKESLKIANPLSSEQEYMRTSLIPSLLEVVSKNQESFNEIKIFEVAKTYHKKLKVKSEKLKIGEEELPNENLRLAGAVLGGETSGIKYTEGKEFYQVKGIVELVMKELGIQNYQLSQPKAGPPLAEVVPAKGWSASGGSYQYLHPGRVAEIKVEDQSIGVVSEIHPDVLTKFGIKNRVAIFDLDFGKIISLSTDKKEFRSLPRFPSIVYDLAFILDKKIRVADIIEAIKKTDDLIKDVELFDVYTGKQIGEDKKSLAVRVTYQSKEKTLTEEEVEKVQRKVVSVLEKRFKAKIRE